MSDVLTLSPGQYGELLGDFLKAPMQYYEPIMLTGIPGIGKTEKTEQICQELGVPFWDMRPIQHDTVEYTGVPYVRERDGEEPRGSWVPFEELLPVDPKWEGMIFVDEVTQLDNDAQKIASSIMDKKGVAGRRIPKGARFVFAGNRQKDRAGASRLLSILESRCTQIEMVFSADDWMHWAVPAGVHEVVRAFCDFAGGDFVPEFNSVETVHAVPRTWKKVSNTLFARPNASADENDPIMSVCIAGQVGKTASAKFLPFRQHYETLRTAIDDCLNNPGAVNIDPTQRSASFAVAGALTERLRLMNGNIKANQLDNVIAVADKMGSVLSALMFVNICAFAPMTFARLTTCPKGREWLQKHTQVMASSRRIK